INAHPRSGTFATVTGLLFPGGRFVSFYDGSGLTLDANLDPVAVNDSPTTLEDVAVTTAAVSNDSDPDAEDTFTVVGVTLPANGMAVNNGDGTIPYTPSANFNGTDSYTYTIRDTALNTATATVTVTVTAVNDAPSFTAGDPAALYGQNG